VENSHYRHSAESIGFENKGDKSPFGAVLIIMKYANRQGFTLIEVIIVIVIAGVLTTVALQSGSEIYETAKIEETKQELDALAIAMTGNPNLENNGVRSDFGYVGDVGSLPPNLDALYSNPGGYTTWNGPYIANRFTQVADDYKKDAFGADYSYSGGITIISTGSGSNIVRRIANSADNLLRNTVIGNIYDLDGTPPGTDYDDSVTIGLTIPDGSGNTTTKSTTPDPGGYFSFDSIPIGNHDVTVIYEPNDDTLIRYVSVLPGTSPYGEYHLAENVWYGTQSIPSLIAHYPLNEDSGQIATDVTGLALNADLQNDATGAGWISGKIDGCFEFDGLDDFFETPSTATELQLSADYSLSVWIWADSNQVTWAAITSRCTPTGNDNHWTLQWDNSAGTSKKLTVYHPGGANWRSSYTLADAKNAWRHIAITYRLSPARIQLYVDGVFHSESTSLTQGPGSGNGKFRIGCDRAAYTWRGKIDDVRVYNRVLTPGDIQSLHNMGN